MSTTTSPTPPRGRRPHKVSPIVARHARERGETDLSASDRTETERSASDRETDRCGHDTSGPTTDDAMTRSEEELTVGTREREAGRARLRKYVVTEMVTQTVPVKREEVRIEREPITDANRGDAHDGPDISEEEHEVVLHEDEVVVDKQAVAKERVRMGTETVSEDREVSEEVRKEQIETEGADGGGPRSGSAPRRLTAAGSDLGQFAR